jgi:hypothetical protein
MLKRVFYRPSDKKIPTPISKDEIPLTEDEKNHFYH